MVRVLIRPGATPTAAVSPRALGPSRSPTISVSLLDVAPALRAVPAVSKVELRGWWADRLPLMVPKSVLPGIAEWQTKIDAGRSETDPAWRSDGPGRSPDEQAALIRVVRHCAESDEPLHLNALRYEDAGGRLMPFFLPTYSGDVLISKSSYAAAKPRHLLSSIRREGVREKLLAPEGWTLIELDYRSCHASLGVALSGDAQLAADVASEPGIHALSGELYWQALPGAERKAAGKRLNLEMLFGLSTNGLAATARDLLKREPRDPKRVWDLWWSRYPALAGLRDAVQRMVEQAQFDSSAIEIVAPSGKVSRWSPSEVRGLVHRAHRAAPRPDGVWRTVFSAAFRAVEGDLLSEVMRRFAARDVGRLVLPMFDGLIVAVPAGREDAGGRALVEAGEGAARALGLTGLRVALKQRGKR